MYFLPDFLAHYRMLGIEQFVFLNDRSDDGSFEYLAQQSDAIVVESGRTYGETVEIPQSLTNLIWHPRILYLWRAMLHDMFAPNRWALQVDLDEFVRLPIGMTFQELVVHLDKQDARAAWGVMLDAYPKDISTLTVQEKSSRIDLSATWYFDGERHLRVRRGKTPRIVYPGARARLYHTYGVNRLFPELDVSTGKKIKIGLRKIFSDNRLRGYNALHKPILLKWGDNCFFRSSHQTNLPASPDFLLPIQHFRFAGSLYGKVQVGMREKSFHRGSLDHRLLAELLRTMKETNGSFLYSKSRPIGSFADFAETGNAVGF